MTRQERQPLDFVFVPVPRWVLRDLASGAISPDQFALIAFLYSRADWNLLAARRTTPTLRLEAIVDGIRWAEQPESLRRQLGRLRDGQKYFTYAVEGNSRTSQRYAFTLLPDEPRSVSDHRPPVRASARPPVQASEPARLARELRIARDVRHGHLVTILDSDETGERPYLMLELVTGGSLAGVLQQRTLSIVDVVRLVTDVGAGLTALHLRNIVHRDVKPSNIMLRADGSAALTDFGLAKGKTYTLLTRSGQIVGTLDYLAPELVRGEEATPASDVYALGCVAFECLTGQPSFADRSLLGVGTAHLADQPPDPPAPPAVSWALLRALEKNPAERPPSATAYAHLLRAGAGAHETDENGPRTGPVG